MDALSGDSLNISAITDPFDPLGGYNIKGLQTTEKLLQEETAAEEPTQETGPGDPPGKKKASSGNMSEAMKLYNEGVQASKNRAAGLPVLAQTKFADPRNAGGNYEFDQYVTNVDRYMGYGKSTFNKLGFNPLGDNEANYNQNTSWYQDYSRMSSHFGTLLGSSLFENSLVVGAYNFFTGDWSSDGVVDLESSEKQARAMALGSSSRGGVTGFSTNFLLNGAYSFGIIGNVIAEELAAAALTGATMGGGTPVLAATTARNASRLARVGQMFRQGMRATSAGALGRMAMNGTRMLTSLNKVDRARDFYQASRGFGSAALDFINPLRGTTSALRAINGTSAALHLNSAAKIAKGFGGFYRDMRELNFVLQEAQLEGGGVYDRFVQENIDAIRKTGTEPTDLQLEEIYKYADVAAKAHGWSELPVIFLTNRLVFDNLFRFKAERAFTEAVETSQKAAAKGLFYDAASMSLKEMPKVGMFGQIGRTLTNPRIYGAAGLKYFRANFGEGLQEIIQESASDGIVKYYTGVLNNQEQGGANLLSSSIFSAIDDQILSKQGIETFLSGFLMGGLISGTTGTFIKTANGLSNQYSKLVNPAQYKLYQEQKIAAKKELLNSANQILSDPERFFSPTRESFINQKKSADNMTTADLNGDDKSFYDSKDDLTFDHVFTSLRRGTFDLVVDGMKEMGKLSDQELAQAFNLPEGTKAKEKFGEYVNRAEQIRARYNYFQENLPNPFKPGKYKKNTQEYVQEFISFKAFEDARKAAVASQYGFDRALERMNNLTQELSTDRPLSSSSASDMTVLLNEKTLKEEISLLKQEVKASIGQDLTAAQKSIIKQKERRLEALEDYQENLKNYNKNRGTDKINDNGQIELFQDEGLENALRTSYEKYLKAIAKQNDDYIFNDKISQSFRKVMDYYELDQDSRKYNRIVNDLLNPANLTQHYSRIKNELTNIFNNREQIFQSSFDKYMSVNELNGLLVALGRLGVMINPEEVKDLLENGVVPKTFMDLRTTNEITSEDSRYQTIKDLVDTFINSKNEQTANAEENQPEEQVEVKPEPTPVVTQTPAPTPVLVDLGISAELRSKLEDAYNQYIENTGSDITFEEFVQADSPTVRRIKAQFNQDKAQPVATKAEEQTKDEVEESPTTQEEQVPAEKTAIKKAQDVIDSVSSIRDLFNMNSDKAVELINEGVSSAELREILEKKRGELLEKISTKDLQKFDIVTLNDGSKVVYVFTKKGKVNIKTKNDAKGQYTVMDESAFLNMIQDVEPSKKVSMEETEKAPEPQVTEQDKKIVQSSRDTMDSFVNDPNKIKKAFDDIMNNKDDAGSAEDDFLDSLGCDV